MRISTASPVIAAIQPAPAPPAAAAETTPTDTAIVGSRFSKESVSKLVTDSAFTAGGGMGGLLLGSLGGTILTHMTGNPVFASHAGIIGTIGGAVTGLAASRSNEPGTLARTLAAWTGATAGTALGMWALGAAGPALAGCGASAFFAHAGQIIGATTGGLAGAAVCFAGHHAKLSESIKHVGVTAAGATAGLFAGGIVQAIAHSAGASVPGAIFAALPLVLGTAGALFAAERYVDRASWING